MNLRDIETIVRGEISGRPILASFERLSGKGRMTLTHANGRCASHPFSISHSARDPRSAVTLRARVRRTVREFDAGAGA